VRFVWLLILWALASAASAQEFGRLYAESVTLKLAQPLEWIAVPKGSVDSPNAFVNASQSPTSSRTWAFRTYLPTDALPTNDAQEVWVRFGLPATTMPQTWFVRVPRLTVWRIDFFFSTEQGLWMKESAGESIAPAKWSLRTRSPSFEVRTRTDIAQTYYMRFVHRTAITELPMLIAPIDYVDGASRVGTVVGLLWGLFSLLAVLSVLAFVLLRNAIFLWFGGFVVSMLLTQLVLMGFASWRLWPQSAYMSQVMNWVAPSISLAMGSWFIAKASYVRILLCIGFWQ
jgi:two-component system, sensor histidine kinase LadS